MNPQNYTINIRPGWGISPVVKVSQGDVGRPLAFTIMDGQDAITLSSTATVKITGTKPSGLGFTQDCTLSGNTASIDTVATMTQEAGSVPAELIVTDGSTVIGTANFVMYVEPAAHPEGTTDGDTETARDLMTRAEQAVEQAEAAAEAISQAGIDTTGATAGQVPTANGAGGWTWEDPQGAGGGTSDDIENKSSVSGTTVTGALGSLNDQIANEQTTRANADESLRSAIDALVSPSGQSVVVDSSLSIQGAAADAKKTGDRLAEIDDKVSSISGNGVTKAQWDAMIQLFRAGLYDSSILADPKAVIDALEDSIENIPSTGLRLSETTISATSTDVIAVVATLLPSNSTDSIHAVSSNPEVCTVRVNYKSVLITPVADGTATITVTTDSGVTGSISVSCDLPTLYAVTNNLTGCTTSNSSTQVSEGSAYSAVLTVDDESYSFTNVTITMGGSDITSTAWNDGTIYIANVTGAIVISVTAEVKLPEYGIVFPSKYVPVYNGFLKENTRPHLLDRIIFDIKITKPSSNVCIFSNIPSPKWMGIVGSNWQNSGGDIAETIPMFDAMPWGERTTINYNLNIAQSASTKNGGKLGWSSGGDLNYAMTLYGVKCLKDGVVIADYKAQSDYSFKDSVNGYVVTPDVTTGLSIEEVE